MKDALKRAIQKVVTEAVGNANTIGDVWAIYDAATLAKDAGPVQRQECRRAFYAGAAAALELFIQIADPGFEEDAGVARLEAMQRELVRFAGGLETGRE